MFGIGATELIVVMVVALLIFGPKRLPELARSLGRGMAEFRRASSDLRQTLQEAEPPTNSLTPPEPAAAPEVLPGDQATKREDDAAAAAVPQTPPQPATPGDDDEPDSRSG